MKAYIGYFMLLFSFQGYACTVPPSELYAPATELISRTKDIVLATAIKAELDDVKGVVYTFRKERILKGAIANEFQIVGFPPSEGSFNDFNHHRDKRFWDGGSGREFNGDDCQIHPAFGVGLTYLLFLSQPYHSKGFELITMTHGSNLERDKWLQFVERETAP